MRLPEAASRCGFRTASRCGFRTAPALPLGGCRKAVQDSRPCSPPVIHRGGWKLRFLAEWKPCGGGGGKSRKWCCRAHAEAAADLVRRSVRNAPGLSVAARCAGPDQTPSRPGCRMVWGAAAYEDAVRAVLLAHKERGALGLAGVLGRALAAAVRAAARRSPGEGPLLLVPVPSSRGAVRARGMTPAAGSPVPPRPSCAGAGYRRGCWGCSGSGARWPIRRAWTPRSGWRISRAHWKWRRGRRAAGRGQGGVCGRSHDDRSITRGGGTCCTGSGRPGIPRNHRTGGCGRRRAAVVFRNKPELIANLHRCR